MKFFAGPFRSAAKLSVGVQVSVHLHIEFDDILYLELFLKFDPTEACVTALMNPVLLDINMQVLG
jgi:hypothetical protein